MATRSGVVAVSTVPRLWRAVPADLDFPFPVAELYTRAMVGDSLAARLAAAVELGERTQATLEPIFRNTPHAAKYRRP
jgi:hypothetical protein